MRRRLPAWLPVVLALVLAMPAVADDLGAGLVELPANQGGAPEFDDPIIRDMLALDAIAPFEDLAPLWNWRDRKLQGELDSALSRLSLDDHARRKKLAVALVDVTDPERPRVAAVNGDTMIYAASLPKIAVLLAAFEKIAQGRMVYDGETRGLMERMILRSDNNATTELMHRVGKQYIARVLLSPRYRLYDPKHNGGLWVGKDYAARGLWKRDPIHNLSHGATAIQVARFYYLLHTEQLVTPEWSREMKRVMQGTHIDHKFVHALRDVSPLLRMSRKSGSWGNFHSDSALIEHDGRAYIAVALSNDARGNQWLQELIVELDRIVVSLR